MRELTLKVGDRVESVDEFMFGYNQLRVIRTGHESNWRGTFFDYIVRDELNGIDYGFDEGELVLATVAPSAPVGSA